MLSEGEAVFVYGTFVGFWIRQVGVARDNQNHPSIGKPIARISRNSAPGDACSLLRVIMIPLRNISRNNPTTGTLLPSPCKWKDTQNRNKHN